MFHVKLKGGGFVLALLLGGALYGGYVHLQGLSQQAAANRLQENAVGISQQLQQALGPYYRAHGRVPVAGQVALPPPPSQLGVRAWALQSNGVVLLDTRVPLGGGRYLQAQAVPAVTGLGLLRYDLTADADSISRFKLHPWAQQYPDLQSSADIPARLAENSARLQDPARRPAAQRQQPRSSTGTVWQAPSASAQPCGADCLQPMTCASPRPLLCFSAADFRPSPQDHRGSDLATQAQAHQACQSLGTDYRVASVARIQSAPPRHTSALPEGVQYWVHDNRSPAGNCWITASPTPF